MVKICKVCKKEYDDHRAEICNRCYCKEYYRKNRESEKAKNRKYREEHREEINEYGRQYYWEHREERIAGAKLWQKIHAERHRSNLKEYKAELRTKWKSIIKEKFGEVKCSVCGYDKYFEVLSFHHTDLLVKENDLGVLMGLVPTKDRVKELDKGYFLCPTHHMELHWELKNK